MHTHKAAFLITRGQKTAKTECGITVKVAALAINSDCSCPGCREAVDRSAQSTAELTTHLAERGINTDDLQRTMEANHQTRYQTRYFF